MPRPYSTGVRGKNPAQLNREIAEALARPSPQEQPPPQCYACGAEASGIRDRRPEGGRIEAACGRHADPTVSHLPGHRSSHSSITPGVVHVIQGNYGHGHGWEDLTAETLRSEALERLREYRDNEPGTPFRKIRRREPGEKRPPGKKRLQQKSGTRGPSTRARQAHATRATGRAGTRAPGLDAYRRLIGKAIERCSRHPRENHSLYECVFEEVHDSMPYPTPQMQRILENAVHAARPASNLHAHARKKKLDPHAAKQRLKTAGIDFSRDFHQLPSSQVQLLLDTARTAGYRKRKDAPGSTARMYYQYLSKIR